MFGPQSPQSTFARRYIRQLSRYSCQLRRNREALVRSLKHGRLVSPFGNVGVGSDHVLAVPQRGDQTDARKTTRPLGVPGRIWWQVKCDLRRSFLFHGLGLLDIPLHFRHDRYGVGFWNRYGSRYRLFRRAVVSFVTLPLASSATTYEQ